MKKHSKKTPTNYLIIFLAILLLFAGYLYKVYLDPNVDYLAYAGAIVGGLFTVVGVTMTINYENDIRKEDQQRHNQERKEDLSIQYRPILVMDDDILFILSNQDFKIRIDESRKVNILEYANNQIRMKSYITIKNVGRGEAKNVSISSSFSINNLKPNDSIELTPELINIIPKNHDIQVSSLLCFKNIFKNTKNTNRIPTDNTIKMNVEYVLKYTDLYTFKNYISIFCCKYTFEITNEQILISNKSYKNIFKELTKEQ